MECNKGRTTGFLLFFGWLGGLFIFLFLAENKRIKVLSHSVCKEIKVHRSVCGNEVS